MKPKHFCSAALCCILILLSACNKDDNDNPLRFYNDTYEVPMGGIRYLGLESGNGDYSLEVEDQRLISAQVEDGTAEILPGISDIFLINNRARDVYFFNRTIPTAFSSGLVLVAKGTYTLEPGDGNQAHMTLTFTEGMEYVGTSTDSQKFILHGNPYILHRLDKNLNLNWDTPPIGDTRTSPEPPPSYILEEEGTGKQLSFSFTEQEIPEGILP